MAELIVACFNFTPYIVPNNVYQIVFDYREPFVTCAKVPKTWLDYLRHANELQTGIPIFYEGEAARGCRIVNDVHNLVHVVMYLRSRAPENFGSYPILSIVEDRDK